MLISQKIIQKATDMAVVKRYVEVLLPLKLMEALTYRLPDTMADAVSTGSWVEVPLRGHPALGVVMDVRDSAPVGVNLSSIEPVEAVLDIPAAAPNELALWLAVAEYYLCTPGEVFKAACNAGLQKLMLHPPKPRTARKKAPKEEEPGTVLHELSPGQKRAVDRIRAGFSQHKPVLLRGVTGSGKTEVYLHLAAEQLRQGRDVLYLVPEIAVSQQLEQRLEAAFGSQLLVYHSRTTIPQRYKVIDALRRDPSPRIVIGTRSAVFLPFRKLGLIVIDEEHDRSYKQDDIAPRYNGRDTALMLATLHKADVLLGSATPSCEARFNVQAGKFALAELPDRFFGGAAPSIEIIDMAKALRLHNMDGSFSRKLLKEMGAVLDAGKQVLVFRSRRAYSPVVQCETCGKPVMCPHCNVTLSYHRFNGTLSCHYCGYHRPYSQRCPSCGEPALVERGNGTEKLEEELQAAFPGRTVVRFDADTTQSKTAEKRMIHDFATGKIDIMVGTQMITKGFDFENLALTVIVGADSLFAVQDFRSDERALELLTQLMGRSGRRGEPGRLVIQTFQPDHPVLQRLVSGAAVPADSLLAERKAFQYPPYVRMIAITVKDRYEGRAWNVCRLIREAAEAVGISDLAGPTTPAVDVVGGEHIAQFWIKLPRNRQLAATKKALFHRVEQIDRDFKGHTSIVIDVDPS